MSTEQVDDLLKEHYRAQSLNTEMLQTLKQQINATQESEQTTDEEETRPRNTRLLLISAISAIAASIAIVSSLAFWFYTSNVKERALTDMVVAEVAMNHHKGLSPDYMSDDFDHLSQKMDKLDFQLVQAINIDGKELTLVGARYCSVGPLIAAQLKYIDERGRVYTLYQSKDDPYLKMVKNQSQIRDGTTIEVWRESGVWMALAGPAE